MPDRPTPKINMFIRDMFYALREDACIPGSTQSKCRASTSVMQKVAPRMQGMHAGFMQPAYIPSKAKLNPNLQNYIT